MQAIEFSLGLFGLLLGFIMVEVLSGLMRTLRARSPNGPGSHEQIRIGWMTPMLGAFTMLNVLWCGPTLSASRMSYPSATIRGPSACFFAASITSPHP